MATDQRPHVAIRSVVANPSRLANWLEARELQQEAALVAIEAARTWRPGVAPMHAYQASAVARHLDAYVAAQASPVHHREHHRAPSVERASEVELANHPAPSAGIEWRLDLDKLRSPLRFSLSRLVRAPGRELAMV